MTTYKYKGQSLSGARVSGVVRAYDEFEAVAKLRDTCAFITKKSAWTFRNSPLHAHLWLNVCVQKKSIPK